MRNTLLVAIILVVCLCSMGQSAASQSDAAISGQLVIFHAGDHANKERDLTDPFSKEIDYLAKKEIDLDIAFLPITGCGFRDEIAVKKGNYYVIEQLQPKVIFPMHAAEQENLYKEFARDTEEKNFKTKVVCAENRGDRFFYSSGKIK